MSLFDDIKQAFINILAESTIRLRFRRGAAADWSVVNPILADGEPGYESDTHVFKIGDGVTSYNDLVGFPKFSSISAVPPIQTLSNLGTSITNGYGT